MYHDFVPFPTFLSFQSLAHCLLISNYQTCLVCLSFISVIPCTCVFFLSSGFLFVLFGFCILPLVFHHLSSLFSSTSFFTSVQLNVCFLIENVTYFDKNGLYVGDILNTNHWLKIVRTIQKQIK